MKNLSRLALVAALTAFAGVASAQLVPDRAYYGINRAVPMTVKIPEGKQGEAVVQLLKPVTAEKAAEASVLAGSVNLATLFPSLWTTTQPTLLYAQLVVGGEKVGPAVVLQPMVNPKLARAGQPPTFMALGNAYSGVRAYVDKHVVMTVQYGMESDEAKRATGEITFRMRPDQAPNTVWNYRELVAGGFYTDIVFHRIMGGKGGKPGFMVQVGDPAGTGEGGPGYYIDLEESKLPHDLGVLSMARTGEPNTGGSQVFICLSREGTSFLDRSYTGFAEAIGGAEVLKAVADHPCGRSATGEESLPADPKPKIKSMKLVDAAPYGTGPKSLAEQAKPEAKPASAPASVPGAAAPAGDGKNESR